MKNTLQIIAMLLLVSSCGLFKKVEKTNASQEFGIKEKNTESVTIAQKTGHIQVVGLAKEALVTDEYVMQVEGEGIQIMQDGVVQLHKEKVYAKKEHYSEKLQLERRLNTNWKDHKAKSSQQIETKTELTKEQSKEVAKPAVSSLLYFLMGCSILVGLIIWWINKRKLIRIW
ncbi:MULTISPECIES: hypothetical protein [Sphingobacterium]|uniref:hypothetical protein n=1 Tax=Sphingobacterium TaxID=28453 RepID=UPI0008A5178F|nr:MULTISPECIES: hypothetical protein [Sphingobacterium]OFV16004.1 hypothetical protein HMPREF3127_11590 [Sphingobacterium sp. HMSC13C05]HAF33840.1 hypothetical protein [Sphingobacterium sp.]HAL52092.1 hypothetical protein [Sphingobacterium sp.]HBW81097.1 hypothetical protein [Sphingobacterium sp.]